MNNVKIQSPTRIDLAGGTLDLWPLFNFTSGASTINLAIDIFTEAEIQTHKKLIIESDDLRFKKEFTNLSEMMSSNDSNLFFYQVVFKQFLKILPSTFHFRTKSWSPVGGGLGGSSSLIISMMKAIHHFTNKPLPAIVDLVRWAHNIESEMLTTPTGTQDFIAAAAGGLNIIRYHLDKMEIQTLSISETPFEQQMVIVNTGRSHHSGLNNFEVLKSAVAKDKKVLDALQRLKIVSEKMAEACLNKNWKILPELFASELEARLMLTPAYSSPEIEALYELSKKSGALGLKICGAGGGGCVMIWTNPEDREKIAQLCREAKFQVLNTRPVKPL